MGKYERRIWFERLCAMRDAYRRTEHLTEPFTVTMVIDYALDIMDDPDALAAFLAHEEALSSTQARHA